MRHWPIRSGRCSAGPETPAAPARPASACATGPFRARQEIPIRPRGSTSLGHSLADAQHTGTEAPLLQVEGLTVTFRTETGVFTAVDDLSFHVNAGETLAIVGESGSGKSVSTMAVTRLIDHAGGQIASGRIAFRDREGALRDLAAEGPERMRRLRGNEISMIF